MPRVLGRFRLSACLASLLLRKVSVSRVLCRFRLSACLASLLLRKVSVSRVLGRFRLSANHRTCSMMVGSLSCSARIEIKRLKVLLVFHVAMFNRQQLNQIPTLRDQILRMSGFILANKLFRQLYFHFMFD